MLSLTTAGRILFTSTILTTVSSFFDFISRFFPMATKNSLSKHRRRNRVCLSVERERAAYYLFTGFPFISVYTKTARKGIRDGASKKGQHLTSFSTNLRFPPFPFLCNTSSGFRLSVYIDVTKQTVSTKTSSVNFLFFYY